MRRHLFVLLLVAAGVGGWFGRQAIGEDAAPGGGMPGMPSPEEMQKFQKAMEELATPGEPHKLLAAHEGEWNVAAKYWENGKESEGTGTATFRMILGGRWQEQVHHSSMMGMPFEGRGLTGYDNQKKQYVNYWLDTMSTAATVSTGQMSDDHKVLTLSGTWEMPPPMGTMPYRMVETRKDDNQFVLTMYSSSRGQETKVMELTYTRK